MEQAVIKDTALWIEVVRTLGLVIAAVVPSYLAYRGIKKRIGGKDGSAN